MVWTIIAAAISSVFSPGAIWLRSVAIRLAATTFYLGNGLRDLPGNLRHALTAVDLRHPPELIPGLPSEHTLSFRSMIGLFGNQSIAFRLIIIPVFMFCFLPAYLYRWSLKSTCWLYLPLIYLLAKRPADDEGLLVDDLDRGKPENLIRKLAAFVMLSFAVCSLHLAGDGADATLRALLDHAFKLVGLQLPDGFKAGRLLLYLFAFDIRDMAPWQWLGLVAAVLTGLIWAAADRANRQWEIRRRRDPAALPDPHQVRLLVGLFRLRQVVAAFCVVLSFGYAAAALWHLDMRGLPEYLAFLHRLYGPYLPA